MRRTLAPGPGFDYNPNRQACMARMDRQACATRLAAEAEIEHDSAPALHTYRVLVINPGSTSTKVALYQDEGPLWVETVRHPPQELARSAHIADPCAMRLQAILSALAVQGIEIESLDAVVGRGGILGSVPSGVYRVNEAMLDALRHPAERQHASNLGAILAHEIAGLVGAPAFIVDPVSVDELEPLARVSGWPEIERRSISHALNLKATARKAASDMGRRYEELNLIGVHLGGGITVSAHHSGRMIDVNQALDGTGPFSPERAGGLPIGDVIRMCYSAPPYQDVHLDYDEMMLKVAGRGGLVAHLGTNDAEEVERRIAAGDEHARLIYEAMAYQIAKEIGGMAAVLQGQVDAIFLTGGLAFSKRLVGWIVDRTAWIAPVRVYPGQDELEALALGALRVLCGSEKARQYR